jgi:hypothetical protein
MVLSRSQILERLKNPQKTSAIQTAVTHEDKIKFHTKTVDSKEFSPYFSTFLKWVESDISLPADKLQIFKGMCQFPLATNVLCDTIFDEYEKIYTAQDSFFDVDMQDDSLKADFLDYLENTIKLREYLKGPGFEEFKTQPNCIYVIDLATDQKTRWPEPYRITVDINTVHDIEIVKMPDGLRRIGFLIYHTDENTYYVLDDVYYRRYTKVDGEFSEVPDIEEPHYLLYTPARFAIQNQMYNDFDSSPVTRKGPLSREAANLNWLLFFKIAERMVETYGPFPIATIPKNNCDYTDPHGAQCNNGILAGEKRNGAIYERKCPACNSKSSLVGPGTVFARPIAKTKDDVQLVDPVTFTSPETANLEYITKKIDYYEREIFANSVGDTDQTITKEAVNEDQVQANFEGRKSVLSRIKKERELLEVWTVDTIGKLRYGNLYIKCVDNLGDQWLLQSPDELITSYDLKKKAGLPAYLIGQAKESFVQTEYRNNPSLKARMDLMELLEPWPDRSIDECVAGQFDFKYPEKFLLKFDFNKFIRKFELQNGDIVIWGSALTLDAKIEKLDKILLDYGKQEYKALSKEFTERQSAETENLKQKGKGSPEKRKGR